jgi:hypothetical protein
VQVSGSAESTTYVSSTQLTATVPASQITKGALLGVIVMNGTVSSSGTPVNLEIDNPVPTITSINPNSEAAGISSAVVAVTGTGFDPSTVIDVNGSSRTTSFTTATQVSVTLTHRHPLAYCCQSDSGRGHIHRSQPERSRGASSAADYVSLAQHGLRRIGRYGDHGLWSELKRELLNRMEWRSAGNNVFFRLFQRPGGNGSGC